MADWIGDRHMDAKKRKRLEAAGWTFGDFRSMTDGEREVVEMHLAAERGLERLRAATPARPQATSKFPLASLSPR